MDILYRVFYTVFSMGILMAALLPVMALLRILLRNHERKYMIWAWRIFYLRAVCPVALSSLFCLSDSLNRRYHLFLAGLGLTVEDKSGVMNSWRAVFQGKIETTLSFRICSLFWAGGVLGLLGYSLYCRQRAKKQFGQAALLMDSIYETDAAAAPVILGVFHKKIYLPKGFRTREMQWLLRHVRAHRRDTVLRCVVVLVTFLHWFNPVMWLYLYWWQQDRELFADERTVRGAAGREQQAYAQALLNFAGEAEEARKSGSGLLFPGIVERNLQKRAQRLLYRPVNRTGDRLLAWILLFLTLTLCFLLAPLKTVWAGGTWGMGQQEETETLFSEETTVVAQMGTDSPSGLAYVVRLEMLSGSETETGYEGSFAVVLYDSLDNKIDSCKVSSLFAETEAQQVFSQATALCISDYNGDGAKELVIGQQVAVPDDKQETAEEQSWIAYCYALLSITDENLNVICNDIVSIAPEMELGASIPFDKDEDLDTVFSVQYGDGRMYYLWDEDAQAYEAREMTEEELAAYKETMETSSAGETQEYRLESDDGTTQVLVYTKADSTRSEVIQSVTLSPYDAAEKFTDIEGYYCDVLWVQDVEDDTEQRYAQIIYNGTSSQTFVIYDTQEKEVYYRHEDGTDFLYTVFSQYGEDDITFEENGAVLYSLTAKSGDVLTIQFAASADHDVTVRGSYEYDVAAQTASNLTFSRISEE